MRLYLLTLSILAATPAYCMAQVWVWQNAESLTPNALIDSQGTLGASLLLRCDSTVAECKWRIRTRVRIDTGTLNTYNVWLRDPAGPATSLRISDTSFTGTPWSNVSSVQENTAFLSRIGATMPIGQPAVPAGPTIHTMYSYVLTSQAAVAPGTLTQLRAGSDGFLGFEPADPIDPWRIVAFGGNPAFEIGGFEWPNPVIHINYVPEPATAALLLAPAVVLLRRLGSRHGSRRRGMQSEKKPRL